MVYREDSVGKQQVPVEDREQARLAFRLRAAFEADPLEDGMYHAAEQIIRDVIDDLKE